MKPIQDRFNDTCLAVETETAVNVKRIGTKIGGTNIGRRIDYIYVDPESFEVKRVGIVEKYQDASDHYAYFVYVEQK